MNILPSEIDSTDNFPHIPVIITSGHIQAHEVPGNLPLPIAKPYSLPDLTKLFETLLAAATPIS
jgi:hypothetical protein